MGQSATDEFLILINKNLGIAYKVCRIYFDDVETREDVKQEMMYQLWKSFQNFNGQSKFSTWMYSVCLNTALTYKRRERKKSSESLNLSHDDIADHDNTHEEESMRIMFEGISSLTPINKAIVLLYLEDLTYDDIARITGLTKSNVSVRLVRIKKELEAYISKKSKG